jgi:hypothetical protein
MESNQMEIVLVAEVANDAKAKDARDFADLQLAMIGGGCAEVSLS